MKKRAREVLAGPIYFAAFCFHLLCVFFTWLADVIAGEQPPKNGGKIVGALLILGFTAWVGVVASSVHPPDVFTSERKPNWNVPHGYSPEQLTAALPNIRNNACLEAQGAVRTALKPKAVGFMPCTFNSDYDVSISDDLQDITVSGVADIGTTRKPFTVKLQHYPPAIWAGGFIALEVR